MVPDQSGDHVSTQVLVIEDHPLYRTALVDLVGAMSGWTVAGQYADAESALADPIDADVVLLDLGLPGMDGLAAIGALREQRPRSAVLVLTMNEEPAILTAAIRAGAHGYLVKGAEPEDIERALQGVARGQAVFGEQVAGALLAQAARRSPAAGPSSFPQLTSREVEVLDLVTSGRTNTEIAEALFVTPKTARNHVSAVLTKLGVTSRTEAAARGREAGLGRD
jgi:DNA-binding NarL/FixJ family response regulator